MKSKFVLFVLFVTVTGIFSLVNTSCKAPTAPTPTLPLISTIEILPTPTPVPTPPIPSFTPTAIVSGETPSPTAPLDMPMVVIPAGKFIMGSDKGIERPPHEVYLETFMIDIFEVTNEMFARFVEETGYITDAEKAGEEITWRTFAEGKPKHPVVKVSWNDAKAFCEWAGKRLPTEAEWEKAARGVDGRIYPWGNEWDPSKANVREAGYRGTTIVGSFPAGASPYGVMDMAGNVAEWVSDWFLPYPGYPGGDSEAQYFGEKFKVIRGGGWFSTKEQVRTTARSCSSVNLANDDVGFRCAK